MFSRKLILLSQRRHCRRRAPGHIPDRPPWRKEPRRETLGKGRSGRAPCPRSRTSPGTRRPRKAMPWKGSLCSGPPPYAHSRCSRCRISIQTLVHLVVPENFLFRALRFFAQHSHFAPHAAAASADKIGADAALLLRENRAGLRTCLDAAQQPGHVSRQVAHGLQPSASRRASSAVLPWIMFQ